jgi:hypothetical protein
MPVAPKRITFMGSCYSEEDAGPRGRGVMGMRQFPGEWQARHTSEEKRIILDSFSDSLSEDTGMDFR